LEKDNTNITLKNKEIAQAEITSNLFTTNETTSVNV